MSGLSHVDQNGKAKMVDISEKEASRREAVAQGKVIMKQETLLLLKTGKIEKGAVLETARVAGIIGVKQTANLIPMCHPLLVDGIEIDFDFPDNRTVGIRVTVRTTGKTGVEMEALTGVSVAALTIYDMCKAVDKEIIMGEIKLLKKTGGKSGTYLRKE